MGSDLLALVDDLIGCLDDGGADKNGDASIERADPVGDFVSVAVAIGHFGRIDAETVAEHLLKRGTVTLAVIHRTRQQRDAAGGIEADLNMFEQC